MTKIKKALIVALSALFVVCICVSCLAACSNGTLDSISVDASRAKTKYISGESLDTRGLVVTANFVSNNKTKKQVLKLGEYRINSVSLTLPAEQFQATKKITVSYSHGEVTKTASYSVTVTKKVTAITAINSGPNKTEYYVGERFDPTGLNVTAVYEDGTSSAADITADNATWEPAGELTKGTTKVTITYGGYAFDVEITMLNAVYIQAIDGLYNGRPVADVDAEISGEKHIRTDASLEGAKDGAVTLYRAHLRVTQADNVDAKIQAFIAGENEDIDEWNYEQLVARFCTTNSEGKYLGEIRVGDTVSFVFSSSEATKGNLSFRLASGFVTGIDINWVAAEMSDIDFGKLCDMYVNGVQKQIKEGEVILEGGKTEDGSPCVQLWMFWSLVTFEDIDFVQGRNVIELKFKDIGERNAYNNPPTCNMDSLIVTPAEGSTADIDLYDNTKAGEDLNAHLTVSEITLTEQALTVKGQVIGGYYADIFSVNVGKTLAKVTFGEFGVNYTAVINLADVSYEELAVQVNGVTIQKGELTLPPKITLEDDNATTYEVIEKNGEIYFVKNATKAFSWDETSLKKGNKLSLIVEDGKVYYVIEGNTFDIVCFGYEGEELAGLVATVAARISELINFELQNCPPAVHNDDNNWDGNWAVYANNATDRQVIVDFEKGTYTLKVDITNVAVDKCTNHYEFTYNKGAGQDGWNDFKPQGVTKPDGSAIGADNIVDEVVLGNKKYQIVYYEGSGRSSQFWGNVGIIVSNA